MIISIASHGRSLRPWYNNARIPEGALFGTAETMYSYETDETTGLTKRKLVPCKIPFYCTDFRPTFKANKYKGYNIPVYEIVVWDVDRKKYIHTNTSASQRYYRIGEMLDLAILERGLRGAHVLSCAFNPKEAPCQRKEVPKAMFKGVYGYMSKTPDHTITEQDAIGDDYAENRRFKK